MSGDPDVPAQLPANENTVHRVVLPFKDQKTADALKKQLSKKAARKSITLLNQLLRTAKLVKT